MFCCKTKFVFTYFLKHYSCFPSNKIYKKCLFLNETPQKKLQNDAIKKCSTTKTSLTYLNRFCRTYNSSGSPFIDNPIPRYNRSGRTSIVCPINFKLAATFTSKLKMRKTKSSRKVENFGLLKMCIWKSFSFITKNSHRDLHIRRFL